MKTLNFIGRFLLAVGIFLFCYFIIINLLTWLEAVLIAMYPDQNYSAITGYVDRTYDSFLGLFQVINIIAAAAASMGIAGLVWGI